MTYCFCLMFLKSCINDPFLTIYKWPDSDNNLKFGFIITGVIPLNLFSVLDLENLLLD